MFILLNDIMKLMIHKQTDNHKKIIMMYIFYI